MAENSVYAPYAPAAWVHARGVLPLDRPRVMGVVNVTPDSFYDGGKLLAPGVDAPNVSVAVRRAREFVRQGADVIDVGGESTRPGAEAVPPTQELQRVLPVLEALLKPKTGVDAPISIDTRHAEVASRAMEMGAAIINDVSGLADPAMAEVAAGTDAGLVIGHLRGDPKTMQSDIRFADAIGEVTDELAASVERAVTAGVERPRILVDPGIGFGKTAEQSAALVAASNWMSQATGCRVLIGASRKSFLGALAGSSAGDRLVGSLTAAVIAAECGASVVRVHDVAHTVEALGVAAGIRKAYEEQARAARRAGGEGTN